VEEAHPQPEQPSHARYAVDTEVCLIAVNKGGGTLSGRMFELSLDGCRVRADLGCSFGTTAGIEAVFKINGIAFRLAGTMQWLDACQSAGIHFSPMAPRKREALEELLAELEAEEQARHAAEAPTSNGPGSVDSGSEPPAAAETLTPAKAAGLTLPGVGRVDPRPLVTTAPSAPPDHDLQTPIPISGASPKSGDPKTAVLPPRRERRTETRHAVDMGARVLFIDVRAQISGRILDISKSGCRIRTFERFPVGIYRRVETEFKVDGWPFRLAGVVQALHDRFTVGIRFLDMSPRKRDQLAQLIEEIEEMQWQDRGCNSGEAALFPDP